MPRSLPWGCASRSGASGNASRRTSTKRAARASGTSLSAMRAASRRRSCEASSTDARAVLSCARHCGTLGRRAVSGPASLRSRQVRGVGCPAIAGSPSAAMLSSPDASPDAARWRDGKPSYCGYPTIANRDLGMGAARPRALTFIRGFAYSFIGVRAISLCVLTPPHPPGNFGLLTNNIAVRCRAARRTHPMKEDPCSRRTNPMPRAQCGAVQGQPIA